MSTQQMTHLKCKASAALAPNNLTACARYLAYVHSGSTSSSVYLLRNADQTLSAAEASASVSKVLYKSKDPVTQARFVNGKLVLATATGGAHIFSENGQTEMAVYSSESKDPLSTDNYIRGIAGDGNSVYLGNSAGHILVIASDSVASLTSTLTDHADEQKGVSITSLDINGSTMASGDDNGTVKIWTGSTSSFSVIGSCAGSSPVTSVRVGHNSVVASFDNGVVKIFDAASGALKAEINAHTRSITAVAIHPTRPQVAIVSEDTFMSVWGLPTSSDQKVQHVSSVNVSGTMLTGVAYCGSGASKVATTSYDSRFVAVMPTL